MKSSGYRRGGSNHQDDPGLLKGVLAGERDGVVYPEDRCLACEREFDGTGRVPSPEQCFHRHWRVADDGSALEVR
jgi:hypothetical protein